MEVLLFGVFLLFSLILVPLGFPGTWLMIGGGVPGKTEVISVRMYRLVESLQYGDAHRLAAGVVVFSFTGLLAALLIERRADRKLR